MKSDQALWRRLENVPFDALESEFPFSARLARDNGWSQDFAKRVINEYKRFVYLAMVTGREVTPSDEVDQAWHLHLTYTRHYWGPFTEALGAPLHHGPTAGGHAEQRRYADNYQATLVAYRHEFGSAPPTDIWPDAAARFGEAPHFKRLNTRRYWLLKKPPLSAGQMAILAAFCFAAVTGFAIEFASTPKVSADGPILSVFGGELIMAIAIALLGATVAHVITTRVMEHRRKKKGDKNQGSGCGGGAGCGSGRSSKDNDAGDAGDGGSGCGGCGGG